MWLKALADLPNGVKTGTRFEVPDYQGQLLLRTKAVRADVPDDPAPAMEAEPPGADHQPPVVTRRAPNYRRRDLQAEGETSE